MILTLDPLRLGGAALLSAGWLALCLDAWRRRLRAEIIDSMPADWLVVHASQTGNAEFLAERTAALLATGGLRARAVGMSTFDAAALEHATRILFVVSTYGEGDAPDAAARFAGTLMTGGADPRKLSHLHYAVLALGDRSYANFCGFGRALDAWLAQHGATSLFERIDVDRGDPAALAAWQQYAARLAGTFDSPDWEAPGYGEWRILERTLLNPGSAGAPLFRIALAPLDGALPAWEAGDLAQVSAPGDPEHPREYSVASTPMEGRLELLVRLQRHADGTPGAASGWLCAGADAHARVRLRLRAHGRFRLGENAERPLIAIGNGSGLAGLRGLIRARIERGVIENWLLFGERNAAHDFLLRDELEGWRAQGSLQRLDLAFSRDGAAPDERRYVQHLLREQAATLRDWIERGAAIYVCGSLQGMAGGVHAALVDILGHERLDALDAQGRYRRDVY
ncbi:sulfite reductase subunit alpha [Massilia sp. 9096]|uniref:sulfite reductase subunit alpha n=1 Tax=Massilia sp. 9096 TaxID=1500894 RepID=UPI0005668446|nr:sulfite reductase subunit alpha [Massilia sp. 9096]